MFGGFNQFVIEGAKGVEMYEKISQAFDLCVEFDTYYEIGRVNGKAYTIKKSKDNDGDVSYFFSVWVNVEPGGDDPDFACSMINPEDVELKDGNLYISECWRSNEGVLRYYIADVKLHKTTNIYYYLNPSWCGANEGFSNDIEGKYFFKPGYEFVGSESILKELNSLLPANFYDLSFEEQESICEELESKDVVAGYYCTRPLDADVFFAD